LRTSGFVINEIYFILMIAYLYLLNFVT